MSIAREPERFSSNAHRKGGTNMNGVSESGYKILNGIVFDFTPEELKAIEQRAIDIITGLMIGMKGEKKNG